MQFLNLLRTRVMSCRRGFTLIELLIVIVIIGILAVGFAPTVLNAPKKARDAMRKSNIAAVQQALEVYAVDNSKYPPAAAAAALACLDKVGGEMDVAIKNMPKDPTGSNRKVGTIADCTSGIAYRKVSDTSYVLVTQLEIAGTGNVAVTGDSLADANIYASPNYAALAANTGDYYAIVVK